MATYLRKINILYKKGLPFVFILLLASCSYSLGNLQNGSEQNTKLATMECYSSFEEFAYIFPEISPNDYDPLLPSDPWELETVIPKEFIEGINYKNLGIDVRFERQADGIQEIWFARPNRYRKEDINSIFIYQPASKEWQLIQDKVENTDLFVNEVYLASDGTVWGRPMWEWWNDNEVNPSEGPILSKFNDITQRFEFVNGVLEVPYNSEYGPLDVKILMDSQDKFWFLVSDDGIYYYDPITQITTKQKDLSNIEVSNPILSPSGKIYFEDINETNLASADPLYSMYDGLYYQFDPDSGELRVLGVPEEPWPQGRIFVTEDEQIWFGAVGYKDIGDNSWHLLHPDTNYHFGLGFLSHSPQIILESSNGLLWFNKYTDAYRGTAWYNPETGEGCMFTNVQANIVEDDQQQLWMFADGKLYRYKLE